MLDLGTEQDRFRHALQLQRRIVRNNVDRVRDRSGLLRKERHGIGGVICGDGPGSAVQHGPHGVFRFAADRGQHACDRTGLQLEKRFATVLDLPVRAAEAIADGKYSVRFPCKIAHQIKCVTSAAGCSVPRREPAPVVSRQICMAAVYILRFQAEQRSDAAGLEQLLCLAEGRTEPADLPDKEASVILPCGVDHCGCFLIRERKRLFAQHVISGAKGFDGIRAVRRVRRGNHNGVNVGMPQHLPIV